MREPLREYARNIADLQKIPLFNPRFREVYGLLGITAILTVALGVFVSGLLWLAPWNPNYLPNEKTNIWLGVIVMPFTGLLAGSFIVEFVLKGVHVTVWIARRELSVDWRGKLFGTAAAIFLTVGTALSNSGPTFDLYGYLLLGLSAPFAYWFVIFAWRVTDKKRTTHEQQLL